MQAGGTSVSSLPTGSSLRTRKHAISSDLDAISVSWMQKLEERDATIARLQNEIPRPRTGKISTSAADPVAGFGGVQLHSTMPSSTWRLTSVGGSGCPASTTTCARTHEGVSAGKHSMTFCFCRFRFLP